MIRLSVVALLLFAACGPDVRREPGPVLHEEAKVESLVFTPGFHRSDVDVGIDLDGNLTFVPTTISVPDKHGVVFSCQHGKFFVQRKSLFDRLSVGDIVDVTYREVYEVLYENDAAMSRVLVDYDFLDAEAKR